MIPKLLHYCWFGGNPLNDLALKCIKSWETFLPDYQIIRWDENNFDVMSCTYTREAYQAKKWAFVSDYARFWILYHHGGLYFDTDVEVLRPLDDVIARGAFMGCEKHAVQSPPQVTPGLGLGVAPGLGLGVAPGLFLYKEIMADYEKSHFLNPDGTMNLQNNVVTRTTAILVRHGLKNTNEIQDVAGVYIYPKEYFSPKDVETHKLEITPNTYTIHHYDASWAEWYDKAADSRGIKLRKIFGNKLGNGLNVCIYTWQKEGFSGFVKKILKKLKKS